MVGLLPKKIVDPDVKPAVYYIWILIYILLILFAIGELFIYLVYIQILIFVLAQCF